MKAALAWFMPGPSNIALPRGEEPKTLVCLTSHNTLENREFVANSQRFAERFYGFAVRWGCGWAGRCRYV